jgi:hypothetical protein
MVYIFIIILVKLKMLFLSKTVRIIWNRRSTIIVDTLFISNYKTYFDFSTCITLLWASIKRYSPRY